ncbi:MAG TPA: HD domain-containing protein [Anaerolineales bacterium]|nr:HD domain-containing protein [Anaerolineales bacterium]
MSYLAREQELDKAIVFLIQALTTQEPYPRVVITHSLRVGLYLEQQRHPLPVVLAGLLHDVVEDSPIPLATIAEEFGEEVASLVAANTVDPSLDPLERSVESYQRCKQLGKPALLIKAADILDNVQHYLGDSKPELRGWLSQTLQTFLALSAPELANEPVWQSLRDQHQALVESLS